MDGHSLTPSQPDDESPIKGVLATAGGWQATIYTDGLEKNVGPFKTMAAAAKAHDTLSIRFHGARARLNCEQPEFAAQERFVNGLDLEQLKNMLMDGSYEKRFSQFLEAERSQECRELFRNVFLRKVLSKADVEDRLMVDKNNGNLDEFLINLDLGLGTNNNHFADENSTGNLEIKVYDCLGSPWEFTGYRNPGDAETLYFYRGWTDFVNAWKIAENDTIELFDVEGCERGHNGRRLGIDVERTHAKSSQDPSTELQPGPSSQLNDAESFEDLSTELQLGPS